MHITVIHTHYFRHRTVYERAMELNDAGITMETYGVLIEGVVLPDVPLSPAPTSSPPPPQASPKPSMSHAVTGPSKQPQSSPKPSKSPN